MLSTPVPGKGALLTALSLWWFEQLEGWGLVRHHVVGADAAAGVPDAVAGRAMVVQRLDMLPVECIARATSPAPASRSTAPPAPWRASSCRRACATATACARRCSRRPPRPPSACTTSP
nr:phosphoribosylaminoimidazolesuccinocarboxamide synthase [Quadrisphaera sp. INWT6]